MNVVVFIVPAKQTMNTLFLYPPAFQGAVSSFRPLLKHLNSNQSQTMPSIASNQAASPLSGRSGLKEITGSKINIIESTPQRRRLRSDSDAVAADSPVHTSIKRKSPRRCVDSSPHTPPNLRSDSTVICVSPSSTPVLRKSSRRCMDSSLNSSPTLISDSAAMCTSPVSTPNERKSARRCINSSPSTSPNGVAKECTNKLNGLHISAVKSLSRNFVAKPEFDPKDSLQISAVKEALHFSTLPCTVVCREDEQKRVLDFCKGCIKQDKAGSLYICGCPGTGKSLSMAKVKKQLLDWAQEESFEQPDVLELQCTSLVTTSEIFSKVLGKIDQTTRPSTSAPALQLIQKVYSQEQQSHPQKMMLIIADELDYLITRDRAVLHDLFMLTALPFSRCILIGISNAIDLADRFLPKLQSLNCKPMVITFRAYTKDQIVEILQERLTALPYVVFQPQALELCARKIAAASGDMRKALCVCRSAIDLVESELKTTEANRNSPSENDEPNGDQTTPGREGSKRKETYLVRIDHMARALSRTFKSPAVDTIQSLPQHQQIIMCSAVKRLNGRKKDTTLGELYQSYLEVCKSMLIPGVGILEFSSMCQVLNDQGLLKLGQSREDKLRRIALKVDHTDIAFALQGIRLFRSCLEQQ